MSFVFPSIQYLKECNIKFLYYKVVGTVPLIPEIDKVGITMWDIENGKFYINNKEVSSLVFDMYHQVWGTTKVIRITKEEYEDRLFIIELGK